MDLVLTHTPPSTAWLSPDRREERRVRCPDVMIQDGFIRTGPMVFGRFASTSSGVAWGSDKPGYGVIFPSPLHGGSSHGDNGVDEGRCAGDVLIWDSRQAIENLLGPRQLALIVAPDHFERRWPRLVPQRGCSRVQSSGVLATLACSSIQTLWIHRYEFDLPDLQTGLELALDMLGQSFSQRRHLHRSKSDLYESVCRYIGRELEDPTLDPLTIAQQHGCSVRALHALFSEHQSTVAGFIRQQRLEKCRVALHVPQHVRIGELALRWGFSDAAHFSKLFKSTYGQSPRVYRASVLGETAVSCSGLTVSP
jgi:AraC-like DNA-binding protein